MDWMDYELYSVQRHIFHNFFCLEYLIILRVYLETDA